MNKYITSKKYILMALGLAGMGLIVNMGAPEFLQKYFSIKEETFNNTFKVIQSIAFAVVFAFFSDFDERDQSWMQELIESDIVDTFGKENLTDELKWKIRVLDAKKLERLDKMLPSFREIDQIHQWFEANLSKGQKARLNVRRGLL
jgi:hypothetical protein